MQEYYAYIRVSTIRQGETGSSLQEQRAAIEAYALRHGLAIVQWFEEMETAAKRGRTLFNQMLRLLNRGKAAGVIIHKIDRSARNLKDWADLGELMDRGLQIHFAHESLDLSSTGGRLAADVQAAVAAHYIRNLRDEVNKGFRGRLRQGLYPWPAPLGYLDRGRGVPKAEDPIRAPFIQQAYELYASGEHTLRTLETELHKRGLRNRNGGPVTRNGLSVLLSNEFYIGLIRIWKTGELYEGVHDPIIKKNLFDAVQARLHGNLRNSGLKHTFLYRRMLRCRHCDTVLIGERQKGFVYYRCHTGGCATKCIREEAIDQQLANALRSVRLMPRQYDEVASVFAEIDSTEHIDREQIMRNAKLSFDQVKARLARLTDAYLDGSIERELFEERKGTLLHERASLNEKMQRAADAPQHLRTQVEQFLERLKTLAYNAKKEDATDRRDLIQKATSNLQVDGKNVVITWLEPWSLIAARRKPSNNEARRDTARTIRPSKKRCDTPVCRAARSVYDYIKSKAAESVELGLTGSLRSVSTSPRPQVHPNLRPRAPLSGDRSPGASLGTP